jgi:hypothetical protein
MRMVKLQELTGMYAELLLRYCRDTVMPHLNFLVLGSCPQSS